MRNETLSLSRPALSRKTSHSRLASIDSVRGMAMILMALDHVRYFFPLYGVVVNPTDLSRTTIPLFFTRWITHFCAPAFVLLAGTGAYLSLDAHRDAWRQERSFLWKRGVWLIFLEFTWVNAAFAFRFPPRPMFAQVLWAIGATFIVLAALVHLKPRTVAALGGIGFLSHVLVWAVHGMGQKDPLLGVLFTTYGIRPVPDFMISFRYPLVPWISLALVGYGLGPVFKMPADQQRRVLFKLGASLIVAFVSVRLIDMWLVWPSLAQSSLSYLFLAFLNSEKYPPSILFLLMTTGPVLLTLGALNRWAPSRNNPLLVFGRTPLFYYLLHIPLAHALFVACDFVRARPPVSSTFPADQWGYSLLLVYVIWIVALLFLYPACRWFLDFKFRNRANTWARYL